MPVMSSLDTNTLMRYIWKDVPEQSKLIDEMLSDESRAFYIPDFVVSEIIFNLQIAEIRRSSIVGVLYELAEKDNVHLSPFVVETVLPFFAEHPALSFVDCYAAFEVGRKHIGPLWTFDKKLANQHPDAKLLK